jgi:hypothetical protein
MTCETQHARCAGGGHDGRAGAALPADGRRRAISPRRRYANRCNARASTGPRTAAGKARAAQNARRHGLGAAARDPVHDHEVEALARRIAGHGGNEIAGDRADDHCLALARRIAEAQVDLMRARRARGELTLDALSTSEAIRRRAAIDRYERRAWSRRRSAIEALDDAGGAMLQATSAGETKPTEVSAAPPMICSPHGAAPSAQCGDASATGNAVPGWRRRQAPPPSGLRADKQANRRNAEMAERSQRRIRQRRQRFARGPGIATPKAELDLIDQRLKRAKKDYEQWARSDGPKSR